MSVLAILLIAVGLTDVLRGPAAVGAAPSRRRWLAVGAGLLAILVLGLLAALGSLDDIVLLVVTGAVVVGWVTAEDHAREHERRHGLAIAVLATGVVATILFSGWTSSAGGAIASWLERVHVPALEHTHPDRFLLLLGLALVQLSTGNRLVRLVLASVGALRKPSSPQPADRLRGGRLLGPMERLFILGLGLAGQVTAAGIVIAAKGLIRWPELQATPADQRVGVDEVTEYFLVGSFTSWLLALGSVWLAS